MRNTDLLITLVTSALLISGCAAGPGHKTSGNTEGNDVQAVKAADCKQAIANIEQFCNTEGFSQRRCDQAKMDSREFCF